MITFIIRRYYAVGMAEKEKYFKLLGIEPTTDPSAIKRAYRQQALKYHPDRNPSPNAHIQFIRITEAYEILSGQRIYRKKISSAGPPKTKEEIIAEKVARAKARWQRMQAEEEIKDRRYFKRVATGWKWRFFQLFAVYTAVFGTLLSCDYFLDGEKVCISGFDIHQDIYSKTIRIYDETFIIEASDFWRNGTPPVRGNYSYLFHDLKSVSIIISGLPTVHPDAPSAKMRDYILFKGKEMYHTYSSNSVYGVFPFIHIMFLAPLTVAVFRRPTLRFSIWRLVSLWIIFPTILFFTFSNDRVFHLIELMFN
ncbi:MAG: J domain-containing protein [Crocinitomicaceae bacterium]